MDVSTTVSLMTPCRMSAKAAVASVVFFTPIHPREQRLDSSRVTFFPSDLSDLPREHLTCFRYVTVSAVVARRANISSLTQFMSLFLAMAALHRFWISVSVQVIPIHNKPLWGYKWRVKKKKRKKEEVVRKLMS